MEPRRVIAALRTGWWLPLLGLIVGGGAALLVSHQQTPLYTSTTQFFVSTTITAPSAQVVQGNQYAVQRAPAYARLITGQDMAGRVIDRLKLDESTGELRSEIDANVVTNTGLIDVTVTDPSPKRARDIADAVGVEGNTMIAALESPSGASASPVKLTVTDQPSIASAPSSPATKRNVATGALLGLLVGAGIALARARPIHSVKDAQQAAELMDAPVLGHVVRDKALAKRHVIDDRDDDLAAENFRQLRNSLRWLDVENPPTVIMVSSAVPSEGTTTVVVNLALVLADAGRKVTVVDANLRKPNVSAYLGMTGGGGLSDILAGTADVTDVAERHGERDMWVIPAGSRPSNPGELLASSQMRSLLDKLRGDNDYVLIDAPPVLPVADSSGFAGYTDGVLFLVRYDSTLTRELGQATALLQRVRATVLGVLLNIVPPKALVTEPGNPGATGTDRA
jgi:capsular exopolysaccharide synthesis family protein